MIELYHNNMSTCAQKVRLVLKEKHLNHVEHPLNLRAGDQDAPEYRRLNPNGVVPTLVDNGQAIIESSVICEYLEDAYPTTPALRPNDPLECARMRLWTMQPDAGLHAAVGQTCVAIAFRHQILARGPEHVARLLAARPSAMREVMRVLWEQGLDAPAVPAAVRRYDEFVAKMALQLQRTPWLAGDHFSLADAMALPYLVRLEHLDCAWWWTDPAKQRQAVTEWLQRCKARSSYAAIADYLDPHYLELLSRTGMEARSKLEAMLNQAA
jgi:glutathione S-transferase